MTSITLEQLEAERDRLADLIEKFKAQPMAEPKATLMRYPEASIELQPGEHYAGPVLDAGGKVLHHLVLMAEEPDDALDWQSAMDWAASIGGALPTRQEQALLFANCKPHLKAAWHWSSETYGESASYAWSCYFGDGSQLYDHEDNGGSARAVRRLIA